MSWNINTNRTPEQVIAGINHKAGFKKSQEQTGAVTLIHRFGLRHLVLFSEQVLLESVQNTKQLLI